MVETESDEILRNADKEDISLLVVGDPFGFVYLLITMTFTLQLPVPERRPIRI